MRTIPTRGFNVTLAAALALVLLGGGAALFGPGCARIERYEAELRERTQRAENWALQRSAFRNPSEEERAARNARWAQLIERVEVADGQAALIAQVAEKLHAPSVRALEVTQRGPQTAGASEEDLPLTRVEAPEGGESVELYTLPIDVSFRASYGDALALLDRIERRRVAARLDSLDIKRQHPGVVMHLGLSWYMRKPKGDAG